jgi:hypothetical protein
VCCSALSHTQALESALTAAELLGMTRVTHPEVGDAHSTRDAIKRKMETDAAKLAQELKVRT